MSLSRQEYPALLTSLDPDSAVDVLTSRVNTINKVNNDIADWLQERRRIEETYAASLRKLSRRPQQDAASALGVFQTPWQRIVSGIENMAQSHESLAAKIEADVELPLRNYSTKDREMLAMGNVSGNLSSLAKDVSSAQKKASKLENKGSNKVGDARSNLDEASAQWESQAPYVFEQLQSLDESRVNHLRDVLTQLQTHELDIVEKQRASAESCLNALLNVETADEIQTFALKAKEQRPRRRDSVVPETTRANVPPAPPPPRNAHFEQRNNSTSTQDRLAPLPEAPKEKEKGKLGGLKRLGTVMGRRKNAAPPPPPQSAEKKKEKRSTFAPFRRGDSARSFQELEASGQDLTPSMSRDSGSRATSRQGNEPSIRPESRATEFEGSTPATNGTLPIVSEPSGANNTLPQIPMQTSFADTTIQSPQPQQVTLSPETLSRSDPFGAAAIDPSASPGEDSARNFTIRDQPIPEDASEAQLAMSNMANQLRIQAQSSGLNRVQGSVRGRRDVRNTMFIPTTPDLGLTAGTPSIGAPSSPGSTNTAPTIGTTPTTAPSNNSATEIPAPVKRSLGTGSSTIPEDHALTNDTHSMHSSHSAAQGHQHPESTSPGLNASIIETIHTTFTEGGATSTQIFGEVAISYISTSGTPAPTTETVRLQNFHQLEKCANNPTFVNENKSLLPTNLSDSTTSADDRAGTYTLTLSSISKPTPATAFKYQVHIDPSSPSSSAAFSPILLSSAWQLVPGQASIIFLYSLNPLFGSTATNPAAQTELTLKNVSITVSLDTKSDEGKAARPISAQMMPTQGAVFKKRAGSVVWRFPELVVKQSQERLLVRFMVENNAVAKKGVCDVKFEAQGVSASALGVERYVAPGAAEKEADPFADEDGDEGSASVRRSGEGRWDEVSTRRALVSGKYVAS